MIVFHQDIKERKNKICVNKTGKVPTPGDAKIICDKNVWFHIRIKNLKKIYRKGKKYHGIHFEFAC